MFTGLINGQGIIRTLHAGSNETRLSIEACYQMDALQLGESIAVNGTCLTVESFTDRKFSAYASAETMHKTSIGQLRPGSRVNLERALALGDRLGGHIVSGHVDCVARVVSVQQAGESRRITLNFPPEFGQGIIPKGSVALDGISLTINACGSNFLEVNVIPETWRVTTVAEWQPGTAVNLETDVIGKYVRKLVQPYTQNAGSIPDIYTEKPDSTGISLEYLRENGFFSL